MLFHKSIGKGQNVVLLHGWGFSGAVFDNLVAKNKNYYRFTIIDLPGHGKSKIQIDHTLWADEIINLIPRNSILIGWSLGGIIGIKIATKINLQNLIIVASTPKFIRSIDWEFGIDSETFNNFSKSLIEYPNETLRRFAKLQTSSKRQYSQLLTTINNNPPSRNGMHDGLKILKKYDLRKEICSLKIQPTVYLGKVDKLIPIEIKSWYEKNNIKVKILDGGHMPFLTEEFKINS